MKTEKSPDGWRIYLFGFLFLTAMLVDLPLAMVLPDGLCRELALRAFFGCFLCAILAATFLNNPNGDSLK
jgi:hypothetical protein